MTLSSWLSNQGSRFPNVAFKHSKVDGIDKGIGLFALKDIHPNQDDTLQCLDKIAELEMLDERRAMMVFLVFLKYGVETDAVKDWKMYVDVLPEKLDTPLELLAGTPVEGALVSKLGKLYGEYNAIKDALAHIDPIEAITFDVFKWADGVFWSRVLSFKNAADEAGVKLADDFHMVPFIDFANHALTPQLRWHVSASGDCELRTTSNLKLKAAGADDDDEPLQNIITSKLGCMKHLNLKPMVQIRLNGSPPLQKDQHLYALTEGRMDADSLVTCFLSVVTMDDGLVPVRSDKGWSIAGKALNDKEDLWTVLSQHPLYEILLLRVWTVLLNVVESRLGDLEDELTELSDRVSGLSVEEKKEVNPRVGYVKVMRRGHAMLLSNAMMWLGELQEMYASKPSVQEYLGSMQPE
ncbi:hypothetical protein BC829DRAFT_396740 [Chytridium lagenaria]|nr:hypothetical protein BC829DRAFT_396740 [Chytridium lagenaria]